MTDATEYTSADLEALCQKWLDRIKASEKREDDWRKDADRAEAEYLCGKAADEHSRPAFNIVHSNVETIVPSIYNSAGKPDIRPRHNLREDQVAKQAADLFERAIMTNIDDSRMDVEVEAAAQDAFMAGRGIVRVRFDADVSEQPMTDPMGQPVIGEDGQPAMQEVVSGEKVLYEVVSWRDYRQGPGARWQDVPWVAYRHTLSDDTADGYGDAAIMAKQADEEKERQPGDVIVWEVWCKESGSVYLIDETRQRVLNEMPDPLGLEQFFPQIAPVQPIVATGKTTPVCPYSVYRDLAAELDTVTRRITEIVSGMKVKGAVAGTGDDLATFANADDNTLTPLSNMENVGALGGLDKAIAWWPMEPAAKVLQSLYGQREQIKQAIYEITGISDIIRGQGAASETATAQQIKTEWGSLRIKKMQKAVERAVRHLFVLTVEIMANKFAPESLARMAGMQLTPELAQFLSQPFDHFRVDVESESTIRADLQNNRREMAEFLQGTAQYTQVMAPLVQQSPAAAVEVLEIYGSFARQFNLGKSAEDALDRMIAQAREMAKNPPPNPEAEAQKAEMQFRQQELQAKVQGEQAKGQLEVQKLQVEIQVKQAELALKREELRLKEAVAEVAAAEKLLGSEQREDERDDAREEAQALPN